MTTDPIGQRDSRFSAAWWTAFAACVVLNGAILWHFHDRYWYPTDDGLYAHVADRLLQGDVLNRDIQDIHPGLIHFLHAAAFQLFGLDLVSLRYPLIAAAFAQGLLVFAMLDKRSLALALLASIAGTGLGLVQFMSPTSNWYALSLAFALAWWMAHIPRGYVIRLIGAGFLLGCLTMFRHLSGVWAAMAILVLVMLDHPDKERPGSSLLARSLLSIMLIALLGYLVLSPEAEPGGVLLMALWPVAILVWMLTHVRTTNAELALGTAQVAAGAAIPALPLLIYHGFHGSITNWISDNVFAAAGETQMDFFGSGWYGVLPLAAFHQTVTSADPVRIVNGLYWMALPLLSALNGWLAFSRVRRGDNPSQLAIPVIACFYALVSLYLEGPLYLYYSAGLSLISLLWMIGDTERRARILTMAAGALAVVAFVFHAGQSRLRTPTDILEGRRISNVWTGKDRGLPLASLQLDERDRQVYGRLVSIVHEEGAPDESILALPNDAELYFLTRRRNPSRFYNSALGLRTEADAEALLDVIQAAPPRLIFFRPDDKYNNAGSERIMNFVRSTYERIDIVDGALVYRYLDPAKGQPHRRFGTIDSPR